MAKRPSLASVAEFDLRLKAADEPRWLASRYADAPGRRRLAAFGLLNVELKRALGMSEPMLGRIRVQWWRECLESVRDGTAVRRHDLAEELAEVLSGRPDLVEDGLRLLDAVDAILDDHLSAGGHSDDQGHAARHAAAEACLTILCGRALAANLSGEQVEALGRCGEAWLARTGGLSDAALRWRSAQDMLHLLPSEALPAVAHLGALGGRGERTLASVAERPLATRAGVLGVILRRRI